ncbi:MAG: hypothetical protein QOK39_2185 [Acidimicrobiaceae bacterium]|nr:hypothetical protein [Acidimicrobiaceae bacterium]
MSSVLVLVGVVVGLRPAGAAPASPLPAAASAAALASAPAPARLVVDAGDSGGFIPGRPLPVRVEVTTDVLVAGQLVVSTGSSRLARPVQIPGGSTQRFELVVPTPANSPQLSLQVSLMAGRTRLAAANATVNALPDTEVVGILPELLVGQGVPGSTPLSVDAGTARFVAVSEQDLAAAPASLGPLSVLALGSDDLGRLTPALRQAVLSWTAAGGRLLIDASPADSIAGLPTAWIPANGSHAAAGRGEVVLTSGAMAAGRWAGLVDPAGHSNGAGDPSNFTGQPLGVSLATTAGLSRPKLRWLIAFLLVYIAVVGPVSFIFLRRRRRAELLWIVIPVVAIVFAATSYAVGSSQRSGLRIVHGTIVDATAGDGTEVSYIGVSSPGEATTRLQAPQGWVLGRYDDPTGMTSAGTSTFNATLVDQGVDGQLQLSAGQFAIFQASGPTRFPGQLVVSAGSGSDGHADGIVTNATPYPLHDVTVLIGALGTDVGTLAPGDKATWKINGEPTSGAGFIVEQQLWGQSATDQKFFGFAPGVGPITTNPGDPSVAGRPADTASPANLAVWASAPDGLAPGTRGSGTAVAVGWTDRYHPSVVVAGHGQPTKGATAVVGTAPVAATTSVGDLALVRRVIRGALTQVGPGMFMNTNGSDPTIVAWSLPPAAAGHALSLSVPAGAGNVNVWSAADKTRRQVANTGTGNVNNGFVPAPFVTTIPPPAPTTVAPTTIAPASGAPSPATTPTTLPASGFVTQVPATAFAGPVPVPIVPLPGGGFGPGPAAAATTVTLFPGDSASGVVYVRLGVIGQPLDLSSLGLKVLP